MCDVIEIGIEWLQIWSISQKDGRDVCLCANKDDEVYAYCLKWVADNVPMPAMEERIIIEHTVWGWAIYKERYNRDTSAWEAIYFADEHLEDPQTVLGKKLKAMFEEMIARAEHQA